MVVRSFRNPYDFFWFNHRLILPSNCSKKLVKRSSKSMEEYECISKSFASLPKRQKSWKYL